ncbi:Protein prenyltransferase, alpha subunit [Lasallia pustulata]|uniref:Protein farnesyltransferase/geranylgeranyltransferase type-1 subunit alpha n=1 Tax=Lasallia pustulata TaxID=136370 RepID=A0A1W5D7X8_9LECA|nr:Protein prenyltransferase, alpha subunit [Lasallia pustulata]
MAKNEMSQKALDLTEDVIGMNPAHYTVWLYRAKVVFSLPKDVSEELEWLDSLTSAGSMKYLKNFQIWHHRQIIMARIPTLPPTEIPFLARTLSKDAKNYHVCSYRQWLVRHFSLWDSELPYVESLLRSDIRNNSAWNHRWYIVFGRPSLDGGLGEKEEVSVEVVDREIEYVVVAIWQAPQNQSPWNYLRGVLKESRRELGQLKELAGEFANLDKEDEVSSSHALDFLADAFAAENDEERAGKVLELLAKRYDPIRKNYWNYRRGLLGLGAVEA